jgi:CDP-diacylglycerol--serine O-phosphatidyltransferase
VSRLPTLSLKSVQVPPSLLVPLLVGVALTAAVVITAPFLALSLIAAGYLASLPYTIYRYRWLGRHPEAWGVPLRQRRAVARARSTRRLGLRPPRRRRVADPRRAGTTARRARLRRDPSAPSGNGVVGGDGAATPTGDGVPGRSWRRLGLRNARRR